MLGWSQRDCCPLARASIGDRQLSADWGAHNCPSSTTLHSSALCSLSFFHLDAHIYLILVHFIAPKSHRPDNLNSKKTPGTATTNQLCVALEKSQFDDSLTFFSRWRLKAKIIHVNENSRLPDSLVRFVVCLCLQVDYLSPFLGESARAFTRVQAQLALLVCAPSLSSSQRAPRERAI